MSPPVGEVGIERELLTAQVGTSGLCQLDEVVRKDLGRTSRQRYPQHPAPRAVGTSRAVLRAHRSCRRRSFPRGDAVAVDSFVGESRELRLDVSACSSGVTGEDIPPVPLRIDEEALLSELDDGHH